MNYNEVELALDVRATLGEGALWDFDKQVLYWVDILEKQLHILNPATNEDRAFDVGQFVGTVVPRRRGGLILGLHHGIASFDPETGKLEILTNPESHIPSNRFNDGKCDPAGRFWAGTLSIDDTPEAAGLYRVDPDLSVHCMLDKVSVSNGIVWSEDNSTMYYIDTPKRKVEAFDYDIRTGNIRNRRTVINVPPEWGYPDGMTIDAGGMLWVCLWGGRSVNCWDPDNGELLARISLSATNITSCAFGGADLDELYITSARAGLDDNTLSREPNAGAIFRVKLPVKGLRANAFAG